MCVWLAGWWGCLGGAGAAQQLRLPPGCAGRPVSPSAGAGAGSGARRRAGAVPPGARGAGSGVGQAGSGAGAIGIRLLSKGASLCEAPRSSYSPPPF